ncbi:unnamed protein product, partial [Trichogramma brassicae]
TRNDSCSFATIVTMCNDWRSICIKNRRVCALPIYTCRYCEIVQRTSRWSWIDSHQYWLVYGRLRRHIVITTRPGDEDDSRSNEDPRHLCQ